MNLARDVFPNAKIVIDHYHVIAWGLYQMNALRMLLQNLSGKKFPVKHILMKPMQKITKSDFKKLTLCFESLPDVKKAWKIIQELRKIYYQNNWHQACSQLRKVVWLCEQSEITEMKELAQTLKRRKTEILNFYISKTTNAKTEALHARFETMKRLHCGVHNIDRFAKRLMFCLLPFSILCEIFTQSV